MSFINRKETLNSFKNAYETNTHNNKSQVYIIEADHGVGKSEFIRKISTYFSYLPIDIFPSDDNEELSTFKRLVLELDKASSEYGYDDFRTFYNRKTKNTKAVHLLLKITALFGQAFARSNECDVKLTSLIDNPIHYEKFILKAQTENLFEYAKYVFSEKDMHIIFHHASNIDSGSLDLLSKLITESNKTVFIFENDNYESSSKIKQCLKNIHNVCFEIYSLDKLSDEHIHTYIQQLLSELELQADRLDLSILQNSIEKGDLAEISSILKDFNDRIQNDVFAELRNMHQILENLPDNQIIFLILVYYVNGKLSLSELKEVMDELEILFDEEDFNEILKKKMIEKNKNHILLLSFVYQIIELQEFKPALKYLAASALIKNLNVKLNQNYNNRYIDILIEYYLNNNLFHQLKSLISNISQRLKKFNTQAERKDYFQKIHLKRQELCEFDNSFAVAFAKIAYDANLYFEAYDFINLVNDVDNDEEIIYMKALLLNRCENFEESEKYINLNLTKIDKYMSLYFKLSLIHIMNLIQLNKREDAITIFDNLTSYTQEPLYPYLIRLSNVFYQDFKKRLDVVESITDDFYSSNDSEFSGLHAIYLAYLYALTQQPESAEKSLAFARDCFGNNLIYNHMILHNEATVKFHSDEIDEEITVLLNNAKLTAYDEYDKFAINNNLLVYYILTDKIACLECQNVALELEKMLEHTNFKRFVDKIYYNLYHYYSRMYNSEKSAYFKTKIGSNCDGDYKYKLMYETSWKLPLNIETSNII